MLDTFDWIRQARSASELLATLALQPVENIEEEGPFPGPPFSALNTPCRRCWSYPRVPWPEQQDQYCTYCKAILTEARRWGVIAHHTVAVWGWVNEVPSMLTQVGLEAPGFYGVYVQRPNRFLVALGKRTIHSWLQQLMLYQGPDFKGLLQLFPLPSSTSNARTEDVLIRIIGDEARFAPDRLRIRFYSSAYQVFRPQERERRRMLTFEVTDFLSLLGMARVFRTLLHPNEQHLLRELLSLKDEGEAQFYWGRFYGILSQEAKDMLTAWRIREWPKYRVRLLYELTRYVEFDESY